MKIRTFIIGLGLALASFSFAQDPGFGTKKDLVAAPVESAAPIVDGWQLVQLLVALVVVFCLVKYGLPKLLGRAGNKFVTSENGAITVKESVACGASTLQVVEVRGRTILLGVSPQSVSFLTDLTPMTAEEKPAFFEMVDARMTEPEPTPEPVMESRAVVSSAALEPDEEDEYQASLELLLSARKKMEQRQGPAPVETPNRSERLRRLTG